MRRKTYEALKVQLQEVEEGIANCRAAKKGDAYRVVGKTGRFATGTKFKSRAKAQAQIRAIWARRT